MSYTGYAPDTVKFPVQPLTGNLSGSYTLTYPAASSSSILVTVDGRHAYTDTYSASGTALVFINNLPAVGASIEVLWLGLPTITESLQNFTNISMNSTVSGLTFTPSTAVPPNASFTLGGILNVISGGTGAMSFGINQIVTGPTSATADAPLAVLPSGSAGQLLTSAGTGAAPTWTNTVVNSFSGGATGLLPTGAPGPATRGDILLSGTLNVTNGGSGGTSFPVGQLLVGNNQSAFTSVTGSALNGDTLSFTGLGNVPQFQQGRRISSVLPGATGLTITEGPSVVPVGSTASPLSFVATLGGTLTVANGGTGAATFPLNQLLLGNTTSPVQALGSNGTTGQVLTSGGVNNAPTWSFPIPVASSLASLPIGGIVFGFIGGSAPPAFPVAYGVNFAVTGGAGATVNITVSNGFAPNGVYQSLGTAAASTLTAFVRVA